MSATSNTFTRYNFKRVRHTADKEGKGANLWKCLITLVSDEPDIDEIQAARDFEVLVETQKIPMHGSLNKLSSINFNFSPSTTERADFGNVGCIITLGYLAAVTPIPFEEIEYRLAELGGAE